MKKIHCFVCVLVLLCTTAGVGFAFGSSEGNKNTVTVSGKGVTSVEPDMATINLSVVTTNKNVTTAVAENAQRIDQVQMILEEKGIKKEDISTNDYSLYQETVYPKDGAPTKGDFRVSNTLSVIVRDLNNVGSVIDASVAAGVNQLFGVTFDTSHSQAAVKQARMLAMENAYLTAQTLAESAGRKLGKVLLISETNGAYPMYQSVMLESASMNRSMVATSISPGSKEISVTVSVMYELK